MRFASPWAFALLALLPIAFWLTARRRRAHPAPAVVLPTLSRFGHSPATWRTRLLPLLPTARYAALALLITALARPQHGLGRVETSTDAVAIQIVLDRSTSMAQQMALGEGQRGRGGLTTRLDAVKRVLREFVLGNGDDLEGRPHDLIGLITFARFAETVCPLVHDPEAVVALADAVTMPTHRLEDGTAVGDALALAAARLAPPTPPASNGATSGTGVPPVSHSGPAEPRPDATGTRIKSRLIILLTDGRSNAGERDPLEAADLATQWGVKVYTVAVGAGSAFRTFRGPFGGVDTIPVPSDVDEPTLKEIARRTGGQYHRADDADALREVYAEIDRLEKTTVHRAEYTDYNERFTLFAAPAAALLLLETLLATTILRRIP